MINITSITAEHALNDSCFEQCDLPFMAIFYCQISYFMFMIWLNCIIQYTQPLLDIFYGYEHETFQFYSSMLA